MDTIDCDSKNFGYEICPECQLHDVYLDPITGDLICTQCGLILESKSVKNEFERRIFTESDCSLKSRVGAPSTYALHDKGLSTTIDWRDRDAFGKKLSPEARAKVFRLRRWNLRMRVHTSVDRNLSVALNEMERICSQLSIQRNQKESAALLYRKCVSMNIIKGRSIEAMVAATIYISSRKANLTHTLDDLAKNSRIQSREIGKCYRLILKTLNLKMFAPSPTRFIPRFANDLAISSQSQSMAIQIIQDAEKIGILSGKDPCGLAAASIYVATRENGEHKTQKEIARVAQITEVTVRNRYKELVKCLNLQMPQI